MKYSSYWHDTAPRFAGAAVGPVEGHYDVVVVGGGFTGLGAARQLAMAGAKVLVLEAEIVGFGASGRNGGHLNNGLAHSYIAAKAELGKERAIALYRALDASIDTLEAIIAEEGIDCNFRRAGKLKLASKPQHFEGLARNFEAVHAEVDPDTALLSAADLKNEIGSPFHGAMLSKKSAMMHMGRYVVGLAEAAKRRGAVIVEGAAVTERSHSGGRHVLKTGKGTVTADQVMIATGAYTTANFGYFRRRIMAVGSFIVATRPLTDAEVTSAMPGNRTCVNTMNIGNYWRLSPDNRLIFGGRARFSATSDQRSDARSGAILRESLARIFPQLAEVEIDYCWGGLVDITKDRYPRAGYHDGIWYAMGYSGHGAQLSTHLGMTIADAILGRPDRNPLKGLDWPAVPGHFGKPWFLPLVGLYYKTLDRFQ
ncbi:MULTISPECIES: FAD-binding oxidoreductase [unclassified Rhizobium]|uniref:NAD(P)/FAD-dependent oxidoreductase n=1 Tax=unclassified Rhizobium TaxID=2613769 RepID=UPI000DDD5091|nr:MULTISPECIES: FAD-binding oxidoreductase [unclassified Rhizobium]MBB3286820.1 glycine/D-amino acid oxidase-like deaminating enzyme [Rhizobium sp. BK252]MBB3401560.1 glycine/D-amino acid oxidase-like deaminating enzyme [Rhizobium sp. BK289]MBB3414496.1 glycine/D-amino acid oxidase-like deaminating enzyme [Rhizobium sp. BK284]MBB3482384.1 glycine/D-amino acid oxidase-like deaminating enzyme [Rhizobium sp. BK347]MDK4718316.1 FAD-binding oxidoreductase [Rhizobium sp. CNPSo 3968]